MLRSAGRCLPALVLAAATAGADAAPLRSAPNDVPSGRPTPAPPTAAQRRFCSVALSCELPGAEAICRGVDAERRLPQERCGLARELAARGVSAATPAGFGVYQFLGRRYQVVYSVDGELPMSRERLAFLIDALPLAARLLSRFQKTRYTAEYVDGDKRRFRASKGDKVRGEAEWISGSAAEGRLFCFGHGESRLAFWRLRGLGLVRAEYRAAPGGGVRYRIEVVASPANAMVNLVMRLGVFRSAVEGEVRELLRDASLASRRLQGRGADGLGRDVDWSADERAQLEAFVRLP